MTLTSWVCNVPELADLGPAFNTVIPADAVNSIIFFRHSLKVIPSIYSMASSALVNQKMIIKIECIAGFLKILFMISFLSLYNIYFKIYLCNSLQHANIYLHKILPKIINFHKVFLCLSFWWLQFLLWHFW